MQRPLNSIKNSVLDRGSVTDRPTECTDDRAIEPIGDRKGIGSGLLVVGKSQGRFGWLRRRWLEQWQQQYYPKSINHSRAVDGETLVCRRRLGHVPQVVWLVAIEQWQWRSMQWQLVGRRIRCGERLWLKLGILINSTFPICLVTEQLTNCRSNILLFYNESSDKLFSQPNL